MRGEKFVKKTEIGGFVWYFVTSKTGDEPQ